MISDAALDAMLAAGCTAEQIVAAVKADRSGRSSDAARQAKYRANKKAREEAEGNESNATLRNGDASEATERNDVTPASLSPAPPSFPPHPPNNPLTPKPIQNPIGARGSRLPEDWVLSDLDLAFALSKGFTEQQTTEIFEKFTNYWWSATGTRAMKRDWHKAWKVWILGTRPMPRAGPSPTTKPISQFQQSKQGTQDILNGLKAFSAGSGCSSSENHRLLPGGNRE